MTGGGPDDGVRITPTGQVDEVDASRQVDFELLRAEYLRVSGSRHLWVVGMVFRLDDPEEALDDMHLGADNLVGTNGFFCMVCLVAYRTEVRYAHCPGKAAGAGT